MAECQDHLPPQLADGGVLASQVPANHTESSHTLLGEMCSSPRRRDQLDGMPRKGVHDPQWYLGKLGSRGLHVNVWQTTFFHILEGEYPVFEWVRGTTLRPALERVQEDEHGEFLGEYGALLRRVYQSHKGETVFRFKTTFVVASKR